MGYKKTKMANIRPKWPVIDQIFSKNFQYVSE